jgi:adenylate kinase
MVPQTRLVMLGKQGAGKGTQCVRLARHYIVSHISTGDMLRAAAKSGTEFGLRAKEYMDAGELVPDEVMVGLVAERLSYDDTKERGFILDGFPRNAYQADELAKMLVPEEIHLAIYLDIATEVVLDRLASRRVCNTCGANYGLDHGPRIREVCDHCGGELIRRADDNESAIRRRLVLYEKQTAPLISWYLERDKLVTIDADGYPDDVSLRLIRSIDDKRM